MPIDLVTGGGGYLGGNLAKALLSLGREVRVFDVQKTSNCPAEAEFVQGDMRSREEVRKALRGVERVFHIAFVQSLSKRPEAERYAINIGGMENFLEESLAAKVARFIHTSTIEIYGTSPPFPAPETAPTDEPVGWYGRHKLICEQMLWRFYKDTGVPCSALRMPTICGRGFYNHRPLLDLMDRVLDGKPVGVIGDGSTPGDFVLLEDVLQGFLLAGDRPEAVGEAFNISCRAPSTQREIVQAMIDEAESKSAVVRVPAPLAKAGLWVGRMLKVHDLPADQDAYLFNPNSYSVAKAKKLLGYEPRASAAEAAAALLRGYREDREEVKKRARNY